MHSYVMTDKKKKATRKHDEQDIICKITLNETKIATNIGSKF